MRNYLRNLFRSTCTNQSSSINGSDNSMIQSTVDGLTTTINVLNESNGIVTTTRRSMNDDGTETIEIKIVDKDDNITVKATRG